jgi:hypothetical protein
MFRAVWNEAVLAENGHTRLFPTVVVGSRAMVSPSARQVIAAVRDGQPGTRPTAGSRTGAWVTRMAGFFGRRPPLR